jgi:GNAT superfamily N-acetyltransferase
MDTLAWNDPSYLFRTVCRPALPKDTPDVMELTKPSDGDDYIPYVWADWLADPAGLLAVAEYGGSVVGLGKLTLLSETDWWLEGLRVHPEFQGRKIASHLHEYLLGVWERGVGQVLRLNGLISLSGAPPERSFNKVGEYSSFMADVVEASTLDFQALQPGEARAALDLILDSPALRLAHSLVDIGWRWGRPALAHLEEAINKDQAWWWRDGKGVLLLRVDQELGETPTPYVQLMACESAETSAYLYGYRQLAAHLGYRRLGWMAPLQAELLPLLEAAGFRRDWDDALFIFEKVRG